MRPYTSSMWLADAGTPGSQRSGTALASGTSVPPSPSLRSVLGAASFGITAAGIGRQMHMEPHVPHVGRRGSGLRLRAGMVLTVEPMINLGAPGVRTLDDGWTVVTADGRLSAQFEHTVVVTREGCEVLTAL